MPVLFRNNATTTLASAITASATSIALKTGDGAKFPAPTGGDWFPVTLIKADNTNEVVRCTSRAGDVLTVVRAQEGTIGRVFSAGDRAELRLTNAAIAEFMQQSEFSAFIKTLINDADAAEARDTLELGTAATATLTTSNLDSSAGRVSRTGDFGIGTDAAPFASDCNLLSINGLYAATSATLNTPIESTFGTLLMISRAASTQTQMFFLNTSPTISRVFIRNRYIATPGVWGPWAEIAQTGSPAFTGTPTAPTAAAGTNTTQLATTAFVQTAIATKLNSNDKRVCTAWVNFNGTAAVSIRDSYNVSSITDNGVGDYTINFAAAMANANYAEALSAGSSSGAKFDTYPASKTTAGLRLRTVNATPVAVDLEWVSAMFLGGL